MTLLDTWGAMEGLVDRGRCRAIGLSDIALKELLPIYESARIKPAVVQVKSTSVPAGNGTSGILQREGCRVFGFRAIGSRDEAGAARRSCSFRQSPHEVDRSEMAECRTCCHSSARACRSDGDADIAHKHFPRDWGREPRRLRTRSCSRRVHPEGGWRGALHDFEWAWLSDTRITRQAREKSSTAQNRSIRE